nr:hypothetical protein [Deltaproteobacteria bacterium]
MPGKNPSTDYQCNNTPDHSRITGVLNSRIQKKQGTGNQQGRAANTESESPQLQHTPLLRAGTLLNSLPISFDIIQLPLGGFLPPFTVNAAEVEQVLCHNGVR